jgi:hypothetical protein
MEDELTRLGLSTKALEGALLGFLNQLVRDMKGRKEELGLDEVKRKKFAVVAYCTREEVALKGTLLLRFPTLPPYLVSPPSHTGLRLSSAPF